MTHRFLGIFIYLAASVGLHSAVMAQETAPVVNPAVTACARAAGVSGGFYVRVGEFANQPWYTVPPGKGVSTEQSEQINICIAEKTPTSVGLDARTDRATGPSTARGCYSEYVQKLRISRNGLDYKGNNGGTRFLAGLFGRGTGAQILANEYERCLSRISYASNRCPNGVFSNGADYCIRSPRR